MRRSLVLLLLIAACQRKVPPPTCDTMADHVLDLFGTDGQPIDALARDVRVTFATRCRTDAWSDEVRSCIAQTKSVVEPQKCKTKLTAEQAKALDDGLAVAEAAEKRRTIPPICTRYEQMLQHVVACKELPIELRDDLAKKFATAKASWATVPDKSELGTICGGGVTALKQVANVCPGADTW